MYGLSHLADFPYESNSMNQIKELLVLHHSHTDIGYTHPQPVLWELERRFIDDAIELCEATQDWPEESQVRWTCEVTGPLLYWLKNATRRKIRRFRKLVENGQIGAGAMQYNLTPLISGAELADSLEPARFLREELGLPLRVAINHDVNGLPWPVTGLCLDAGIELILMGINGHFGGYPLHRPLAFRWKSSDGREIFAFNGEHYHAFDRELRLDQNSVPEMEIGLRAYWNRIEKDYPYDFLFLTATHPSFVDNNPPSRRTADLIRKWNAEGRDPIIRYVTPEGLLDRIKRQKMSEIPHYSGDWTDYWNFGAGSSARETRINRESRARLLAAEHLLTRFRKLSRDEQSTHSRAWFNVALYDEHTWCHAASITHPDEDHVAEQTAHKTSYAWKGYSLSGLLMRDALEKTSSNPQTSSGLEGVLFYNPGQTPITVFPRVPPDWISGKWQHFSSMVHLIDSRQGELGLGNATGIQVGPISLPAFGFRVVPFEQLKEAPPTAQCKEGKNFVESPFFRLEFDRKTGRISRLLNLRTNIEVTAERKDWPFFGLITESVVIPDDGDDPRNKGREAFFDFDWENIYAGRSGWRAEWPASRHSAEQLRLLRTEREADGIALVLHWEDTPSYSDLKQKVRLCASRAAVEFEVSFQKLDIRRPEATYLSFPLALTNWEAWYDSADLPVSLDREQLPGTCRDYITVGSYAALSDARQSVKFACPDAPLVQFGDFHFGKRLASVPRVPQPVFLAWLTNNYWNTNFRASQPGPQKFRFELSSDPQFDPFDAALFGAAARSTIEIHPVVKLPTDMMEAKCFTVEGEGILLLQARLTKSERNAVLIRLANPTGKSVAGKIGLDTPFREAFLCDTFGKAGDPLPIAEGKACFQIPSRHIATLLMRR